MPVRGDDPDLADQTPDRNIKRQQLVLRELHDEKELVVTLILMPFSLAHLCMLLCLLECFPNSIPVGQSGTLKLNLSLGYINIGMEDNSIKKIIKDTQFFETTSYKRFEKDIQEMNFKVKPEKIN